MFGLGMGGGSACASPDPDSVSCGPARPTFRLLVDTEQGMVPEDIRLRVRFGSGEEQFELGGTEDHKAIFCEVDRGSPTAAGPIVQLICDMWTDGAATIWISASGFVDVHRDLEAVRDPHCGLRMSEVRVTLVHDSEQDGR